ncbi:hypothetical protein SK128_022875 [Halocaridina rubra]|uniref:Uncharacterized protein n=1 Tax=Halocaridina rubra TaxID=373956 RepID=A0AAN9A184_HALRR
MGGCFRGWNRGKVRWGSMMGMESDLLQAMFVYFSYWREIAPPRGGGVSGSYRTTSKVAETWGEGFWLIRLMHQLPPIVWPVSRSEEESGASSQPRPTPKS